MKIAPKWVWAKFIRQYNNCTLFLIKYYFDQIVLLATIDYQC